MREVIYRWHPWAGCRVHIHEVVDKASGNVARCSRDGAAACRSLELPTWMFDRAACAGAGDHHAHCRHGGALGLGEPSGGCVEGALDIIECPAFGRITGLSRPESGRGPCQEDARARRRHSSAGPCATAAQAAADRSVRGEPPASDRRRRRGPELPAETQAALTDLMTRLILEHADKSQAGSMAEAGHDL